MKVTDKRMFTSDGELLEEYRDSQAGEAPAAAAESAAPDGSKATPVDGETKPADGSTASPSGGGPEPDGLKAAPGPAKGGPLPAPGFLDLVDLLAQPVLLYLGDLELPDGKSAENLPLARMHIDLLDVLKGKTQGNLSDQEQAIVDDLLYRLRLRYVQKTT